MVPRKGLIPLCKIKWLDALTGVRRSLKRKENFQRCSYPMAHEVRKAVIRRIRANGKERKGKDRKVI